MIEQFVKWVEKKRLLLESARVKVIVEICQETENSAALVHLDSDKYLARITMWSDGGCLMEALKTEDGETVFQKNLQVASFDEAENDAGEFLEFLLNLQNK